MKRPWQVWLVFVVCVLGAAGAMAWLTRQALESDRLRREAEAESELEQRVSLALWRMDTELAPIIAAEVIRPPAAYRPAATEVEPPPYVLLQFEAAPDGSCRSPQMPETKASESDRLRDLSLAVKLPQLLAQLPDMPLPAAVEFNGSLMALNQQQSVSPLNALSGINSSSQFFDNRAWSQSDVGQSKPNVGLKGKSLKISQQADLQQRGERYQAAAEQNLFNYNTNQKQLEVSQQQAPANAPAQEENPFGTAEADVPQSLSAGPQMANAPPQDANPPAQAANPAPQAAFPPQGAANPPQQTANVPQARVIPPPISVIEAEQVGVSRPLWIGDRLILARRVASNKGIAVQGCWLDWPRLKAQLLAEATDLLPQADLVPVDADARADPGRLLAGLPVRLVVNENVLAGAVGPTLQWALWLGWGAVLLAVAAAAALLHGVMSLSERRAAFVSSVTHELRTPLTTFRMYAEMLARGMVPDAQRRQEYFDTLHRESERLTLLVENVLAYARLERGRKPQAQDRVTLRGLLERIGPRLKQRAAQAGMECLIEIQDGKACGSEDEPPVENAVGSDRSNASRGVLAPGRERGRPDSPIGNQEFTTDQAVVEQILFNLVDNAAKYAQSATDRRIHVEAGRNGKCVRLIVRDHGPGIERNGWSHSTPFAKSAQESAESAPGVGLGLALCQRLARQLGGKLEIAAANGDGATVMLLLPS